MSDGAMADAVARVEDLAEALEGYAGQTRASAAEFRELNANLSDDYGAHEEAARHETAAREMLADVAALRTVLGAVRPAPGKGRRGRRG